jgi:hypothetical protein
MPTWGIVTDMNEFRLYWWNNMPVQYQRFVIKRQVEDETIALIEESEEARFQRFLFSKIFHSKNLLTEAGKSNLERLLQNQWIQEKELEKDFYQEYRAFRDKLYDALVTHNPNFQGTKGGLVKLAQRILDRLIFILYCEDMGEALRFPTNLLRDLLREVSNSQFYNLDDNAAWERIKALFRSLSEGLQFAGYEINRFDGGLYADDPEINSLKVPTYVFCAKGQGANLNNDAKTLLYLSANYNFGVTGASGERVINLYTLGRIFEQSITELEIKVAEVDKKPSIGNLSKRKRDGVYYTPEWVTRFIVEETIGERLQDLKKEIGWDDALTFPEEEIARGATDRRTRVNKYREGLIQYREALKNIRVLDPACGSGAFLIQALEYLVNEHKRITEDFNRFNPKQAEIFDQEEVVRAVLSQNIYGVDINSESVEIARLALWLHTALADRPLSNLDDNILCGNSLVAPDFYTRKADLLGSLDVNQKERINAFDWQENFAQVFAGENPGFDCVVGNPPYVKLQHFRKVEPETTEYLLEATTKDGLLLYESTQTGNFDLYLPFIERGIALLNTTGRMGYIAPNVWLRNEYGEGLRSRVHKQRYLDKWLDFVSYQVFDESITYTALQFYKKCGADTIHFALAPRGGTNVGDWESEEWEVEYAWLKPQDSWVFLPKRERKLFEKLKEHCKSLGDPEVTSHIFQGLITSADSIYHLKKIGSNLYYRHKGNNNLEVEIEDAIMRPLISGEETKRYELPQTDTYVLYPYDLSNGRPRLWSQSEMEHRYPRCWAYLKENEQELRERERGKFDNDQWYQFGRNQNLDKQELSKLCVAQTVPSLRLFWDKHGDFYINNVRINGILPTDPEDASYLLGALNSNVADFVFRRIAKPKEGGYFEANKQFIAPIPIPKATPKQKAEIGAKAEKLQDLYTDRRNKILMMEKRLSTCDVEKRLYSFLWPQIHDAGYWKAQNLRNLSGSELTAWAKEHYNKLEEEKLNTLEGYLNFGAKLDAEYKDGELRLLVNGAVALQHIFVSNEQGTFIASQWQYLSRNTNITENTTGKAIADKLCTIHTTPNAVVINQILELSRDLLKVEDAINAAERGLNDQMFDLYELTDEEKELVLKR